MARPHKQTVNYFPHDAMASDGTTLTIIDNQFGNEGYAFWFRLLERLSSTPGHYIDCRNPIKWEFLLAKTRLNDETAQQLLDLLAKLDAIDIDLWSYKVIWCQNLVDNIADVYKKRKKLLPQKPSLNGKDPTTAPLIVNHNPDTTDYIGSNNPQSKVNKSKVNKSIKAYGHFKNVLLTKQEMTKLVKRFGKNGCMERVERLSEGMASKGYTYKSHYATILSWERKDERDGTHQQNTSRKVSSQINKDEYREKRLRS